MTIELKTIGVVGKGLTIRRLKGDADGNYRTVACLKLTKVFVRREEIDRLCAQPDGWHRAFVDELGAPRDVWSLVLHKATFTASGVIAGPDGEGIKRGDAVLDNIELEFAALGGLLSCTVSWLIAGDEAGDIEPLLGHECRVLLSLDDGGQQDMLRDRDMARVNLARDRGREACS